MNHMNRKTTKITLADISKAANVSVNTAAKVLAGQAQIARISEKTAKKVRKTAKELGYIPNLIARNLRSKHTGIIAVFIADMTDATYAKSSHLILQRLHAKGFWPILSVAEIGLELCWQEWLQNRIEGLILCGTTQEMDTEFFHALREHSITPVIAGCAYKAPSNQNVSGPEVSTVSMDNYAGMQLAINHLRQKHRKKIAHIAGPDWHTDTYERKIAYENIIKQYHEPVIAGQGSCSRFWQKGYDSAIELERSGQSYDAIVAYDDLTAIGAMKWFLENNKNIPDDIAIVGIDNAPESEFCTPSLTTIAQPTESIGEKTVNLLESCLYKKTPVEKILIMPSLIPRAST
jgi:DNA-binding LacI/PurR family transcriptional regulator